MMAYAIAASVLGGFLAGRLLFEPQAWLDTTVTYALALMVFLVGVDIGKNKNVLSEIRELGIRIMAVPIAVAGGSIIGAAVGGMLLAMPLREAAAVGAGFGWYSLSGVMLSQLHSVELGATAFLANVIREIMALILMPLLVRYLGPLVAIAAGGATTMDSTLPMITKLTDAKTALVAFLSGLVLTGLVPVLIPLLAS